MKLMRSTLLLAGLIVSMVAARAQEDPETVSFLLAQVATAKQRAQAEPKDQKDPAYPLYKRGYNMVLQEKWSAALTALRDVLAKYPRSGYAARARYWSAYAQMHIDREKARAEYEELIERYPKSPYLDDAMADYMNLVTDGVPGAPGVPALPGDSTGLWTRVPAAIASPRVGASLPAPGVAAGMRSVERNLRQMTRRLSGHFTLNRWGRAGEELDAKTRLRLEALSAIGESKDDEKGFQTLKRVALNPAEHPRLRDEAMQQLSGFENHDVASIFLEIARKDTSEEIQASAVRCLRESMHEKDKGIGSLSALYGSLPKDRKEQRADVLYEIADIGGDRSVDFLVSVANTDPDYDRRSDAIYYLGNIGGDRARTALYRILEGK